MDIRKLKPEEFELIAYIMTDPLKRGIVRLLLKERKGLSFYLMHEKLGGSKASLARALHELTDKGVLAYSIEVTSSSTSIKRSVTNYSINIKHQSELSELVSYY